MAFQTAALGITRYSERQLNLYRKIYQLRQVEGLTFKAIAARLNANGIKSTTGQPFSPELVFGLHKRDRLREAAGPYWGLTLWVCSYKPNAINCRGAFCECQTSP